MELGFHKINRILYCALCAWLIQVVLNEIKSIKFFSMSSSLLQPHWELIYIKLEKHLHIFVFLNVNPEIFEIHLVKLGCKINMMWECNCQKGCKD